MTIYDFVRRTLQPRPAACTQHAGACAESLQRSSAKDMHEVQILCSDTAGLQLPGDKLTVTPAAGMRSTVWHTCPPH